MPRIVATISGHGFGHLSISAPVLNRLSAVRPDAGFTVISGLDEQRVRIRVSAPFDYLHSALDFGVVMHRDLSVRVEDTAAAYRELHADWTARVHACADTLDRLGCDLVLSNISYLYLAAAELLKIPAVALCPLNWADMYRYYCHRQPEFESIHRQMNSAYASARVFLKPAPSMPMSDLGNTSDIGPVAAVGTDVSARIRDRLKLGGSTRLVLVAMGGHDLELPVSWPDDESICWLVTRSWQRDGRPNVAAFEDLEIPFLDLLASCDLLIGKPGYGSFTEAACAGRPVLYLPRPDWPETQVLLEWLHRHHPYGRTSRESLCSGAFAAQVYDLLDRPRPAPILPAGVTQAVGAILSEIDGRYSRDD